MITKIRNQKSYPLRVAILGLIAQQVNAVQVVNPDLLPNSSYPGFIISGVSSGIEIGNSLEGIGDFNGDGIPDIAIRANRFGTERIWVVYGKNSETPVSLSTLSPEEGLEITDESFTSTSILRPSGVGDFNGDGFQDLAIGVFDSTNAQEKVIILFGGVDDELLRMTILGESNSRFGYSLAGVGDVNGDGFDDLAVGAPYARSLASYPSDPVGSVWVIFGGEPVDQLNADELSTRGFARHGISRFRSFGNNVSASGDINGDGLDDVLIRESDSTSSSVFVLFGGNRRGILPINTLGESIRFFNSQTLGIGLGAGGDINQDGYAESVLGDSLSGVQGNGYVFVHLGLASPSSISIFPNTNRFRSIQGESLSILGTTVTGIGDHDGDGITDYGFGAGEAKRNNQNAAGSAYLLPGARILSSTANASANLPELDDEVLDFRGSRLLDKTGVGITGVGDMNGDGGADWAFSQSGFFPPGASVKGRVFVLFSQAPITSVATYKSNIPAGSSHWRAIGSLQDGSNNRQPDSRVRVRLLHPREFVTPINVTQDRSPIPDLSLSNQVSSVWTITSSDSSDSLLIEVEVRLLKSDISEKPSPDGYKIMHRLDASENWSELDSTYDPLYHLVRASSPQWGEFTIVTEQLDAAGDAWMFSGDR